MGCIYSIFKYLKNNTNDDYKYKKLEQTDAEIIHIPKPIYTHYEPYTQKYWICTMKNKHPITQQYCHCLMEWCQDNPIQKNINPSCSSIRG